MHGQFSSFAILLSSNDQTCPDMPLLHSHSLGSSMCYCFSSPSSYAADNRGNVITYKKGEKGI
ncbi:hypothetical protein AB205_0034290 [Aquarana catesbeiana]|uniref:Uncharacterized protein n=1 Tax=Aquarana catesbeiana TaxID=8400 RepID=A0A2G9SAY0_AQUCT|nr:hypothetical protein AB205_0034290 [Aquarana catesbeiana]